MTSEPLTPEALDTIEAPRHWQGGDPCASCGSTETEWNWLEGGSCRSCGKGDSDD